MTMRVTKNLANGSVTLDSVRRRRPAVFATPSNACDGFGDGPSAAEGCAAPRAARTGCRSTLRGNRMTLPIDGCEAASRNEPPSPGRPARTAHETRSSAAEAAHARCGEPARTGGRT